MLEGPKRFTLFSLMNKSTKLTSICFEKLIFHHQEDCTSSFTIFYHAAI